MSVYCSICVRWIVRDLVQYYSFFFFPPAVKASWGFDLSSICRCRRSSGGKHYHRYLDRYLGACRPIIDSLLPRDNEAAQHRTQTLTAHTIEQTSHYIERSMYALTRVPRPNIRGNMLRFLVSRPLIPTPFWYDAIHRLPVRLSAYPPRRPSSIIRENQNRTMR